MKKVICIKDCINSGSITSCERMKAALNDPNVSDTHKIGYKAQLKHFDLDAAIILEKGNILRGEEVDLLWEGYSDELDPTEPKELVIYMYKVKKSNGNIELINASYFGVEKPEKHSDLYSNARINSATNNN